MYDNLIDKDEVEANAEITSLIESIKILLKRNDPLLSTINSPTLLIQGLIELRSLIEMVSIKKCIVDKIKFLLVNKLRLNTEKFEGHMLHTVISGKPGCGKTTVAMIIAKILSSLGFIDKSSNNKTIDLEKRVQLYHDTLEYVKKTSTDIRRLVIKSKPCLFKNKHTDCMNEADWDSLLNSTKTLRVTVDKVLKGKRVRSKSETHIYEEPKIIVARRENFIAEYLGQTAPKTKAILESARGGVLFIDEAYSLCNNDGNSKDKFGEECLTTINEFMSLYPDEIVIIFAGYKDKLFNTIFKVQEGLYRRCTWFFEITDYTAKGLARIFTKQLEKHSWKIDPSVDLESIFLQNKNIILDSGGGTSKLAFFVKIEYGKSKFFDAVSNKCSNIGDSVITQHMIYNAIERYKEHLAERSTPHDIDISSMYV